jgi:8-oxo-dGTP pyrophosphatase MutT (NUDIX family)
MSGPIVETPPNPESAEPQVQVDMGSMEGFIGRIKEAPVCADQSLKKDSMSAEELSKFCFPLETPKDSVQAVSKLHTTHHQVESSVVSSASSTASRESAYLSDLDGSGSKVILTPLRLGLERKQSEQINLKVTTQKISRNGRLTQRWSTDPQTQRIYRMVTGCVPIVDGGKILFVSSSRKPEWILPKGGWEKDEAMQESAIRETFEEAGVLGIIGPRLSEIEYETRKSKKRRLDLQEAQKRAKVFRETHAISPDPKASVDTLVSCAEIPTVKQKSLIEANAHVSNEDMARIRGQSKPSDETSSVASDASTGYSHVRLNLMPLYVSEVRAEWPECGRFRKVVDIDEAIRMTESRPEFHAALKEVKERSLHLPRKDGNLELVAER